MVKITAYLNGRPTCFLACWRGYFEG